MKLSSIFTVQSLVIAGAFFLGTGSIHAQVTPGPGGSIVGQPPGQGGSGQSGSVIGQPPSGPGSPTPAQPLPGQSGSTPGQPGSRSTIGNDPVRDKLDRTNREAADLDRDGRISPDEASRMPPGTPLPR
ncbi:hypothetical protein [Nitrosovibrio sp. Nv4]|uniref:hypothetical protein n=1 Tax=Nitrosovibrio sp. Nv4 TaxID=1945880 RepID=UPI000BD6828B|nr:hypothetical protein [Nitrosovibrio sp. Nv4]SOD42548.1 hypothetical protein SAMN06298226_2894 [Nitrosovibrio sp. Nv4]